MLTLEMNSTEKQFSRSNVQLLNFLCVKSCLFIGTTEKIFEEKKDLYDVYVDNQNVKTCRDGLKPLLRLSTADREKYRKLTEQRSVTQLTAGLLLIIQGLRVVI